MKTHCICTRLDVRLWTILHSGISLPSVLLPRHAALNRGSQIRGTETRGFKQEFGAVECGSHVPTLWLTSAFRSANSLSARNGKSLLVFLKRPKPHASQANAENRAQEPAEIPNQCVRERALERATSLRKQLQTRAGPRKASAVHGRRASARRRRRAYLRT